MARAASICNYPPETTSSKFVKPEPITSSTPLPTISLKAGSSYTAIAEGLIAGSPAFKVDLVTDVAS